jgi:hypothetical protein
MRNDGSGTNHGHTFNANNLSVSETIYLPDSEWKEKWQELLDHLPHNQQFFIEEHKLKYNSILRNDANTRTQRPCIIGHELYFIGASLMYSLEDLMQLEQEQRLE